MGQKYQKSFSAVKLWTKLSKLITNDYYDRLVRKLNEIVTSLIS